MKQNNDNYYQIFWRYLTVILARNKILAKTKKHLAVGPILKDRCLTYLWGKIHLAYKYITNSFLSKIKHFISGQEKSMNEIMAELAWDHTDVFLF